MDKVLVGTLQPNPNNPREITPGQLKKLKQSIKEFPEMLKLRPIVADENLVVLGGNMRLKAHRALKLPDPPYEVFTRAMAESNNKERRAQGIPEATYEEQCQEFVIKDNVAFGDWSWGALAAKWDAVQLGKWGLDMPGWKGDEAKQARVKLTERFIVPPFSLLDSRQGYWIERKKNWRTLINDQGESRKEVLATGGVMVEVNEGVSLLDPVLAEMAVRWFGLPGGEVFDVFAGDTVCGYVAAYLGRNFTGIELRQEQADLNNLRVKGMRAKYVCDDGRNVLKHLKPKSQDLLFSCPPYFDLEQYSELKEDASNQGTYEEYLELITVAFNNALKALRPNRFAVIVIGDIRDERDFYRRLPDDVKRIFTQAGAELYNEMVFMESIGTLPQRVGRYMNHRKVGKCHQNVLVFYNGKVKEIKGVFGKLDARDEGDNLQP